MAIRQIKRGTLSLYAKTATSASGKEVVVREARCVLRIVKIGPEFVENINAIRKKKETERTNNERVLYKLFGMVPDSFLVQSVRFILYDEHMVPIDEANWYLNSWCADKSFNTRNRIATALRLLFVFCELNNIHWKQFPQSYIADFKAFLKRIGPEYQTASPTNVTCNSYLSDIRGFYFSFGLNDEPITRCRIGKAEVIGADGQVRVAEVKKYEVSFKADSKLDLRPDFNDSQDYENFQKLVVEKQDITAWILCELMFTLGMRIGECLGLTIEDIITEVNDETGEVLHFLCLRNRKTDRRCQCAKGRIQLADTQSYDDADYVAEYHKPKNLKYIPEELFRVLDLYIKTKHAEAAIKYEDRYAKSVADIVNKDRFASEWGLKENHYLFLNYYGNQMKESTWNKREKKYFHEIGIATDKGRRLKGLNHRWRHGTADHLLNKMGKSKQAVKEYLGHKNASTTDRYLNPSVEELAIMRQEVQKDIHHSIPYSDPVKAGLLKPVGNEKEN